MAFFKNYIKQEGHYYLEVRQISDAILAVGGYGTTSEGLVSKFKVDGTVIWEKVFRINGLNNWTFEEFLELNNGDILLFTYQTSSTNNTVYLFKITTGGDLIWAKSYQFIGKIDAVSLAQQSETIIGNDQSFIMNVAYNTGSGATYYNEILKLDPTGVLTMGKSLNYSYYATTVNYAQNSLLPIGNELIVYRWGSFIRLDANLNLVDKFKFSTPTWVKFLTRSGQNLIMAGSQGNSSAQDFIAKINYTNINDSEILLYAMQAYKFAYNDSGIYAANVNGQVLKVNQQLSPIWSKKISISGIYSLSADDLSLSFSAYISNVEGAVLAQLNIEADSCKTVSDAMHSTVRSRPVFDSDFQITISNFKITPNNLTVGILDVSSISEEICTFDNEEKVEIKLNNNSSLQSPNFYLQAAGSEGIDSTKGLHLRWALRGALEEHLPKANYATNTYRFNKPEDYVTVYRTPYIPYLVTVDFNVAPLQVNEGNGQKNWVYAIGEKVFHVHFRDTVKYNQVKSSVNPSSSPLAFIAAYGDSLLEIENKTELSFKVTTKFKITGASGNARIEVLSVEENKITAAKAASIRKNYPLEEINSSSLQAENIRSVRFRSVNGHIDTISFEFYSDFILQANRTGGWNKLGSYALTKETEEAYLRLEPETECLKSWLRYNEQAYVNPQNYRDRWDNPHLPLLERISNSVERYITLSNEFDNPRAMDVFPFEDQSAAAACSATNSDYDPYMPEAPTAATGIEISYLEILQLGSVDYHNARMLGLGTLDLDEEVFDGHYIYVAEYVTFGDLEDGLGAREVQHLYCSLPTSLADQRLPMPLTINEPVPGRFFNNGIDDSEVVEQDVEDVEQADFSSVELTEDGYTPDGKTRYYTFYTQDFHDEEFNKPFYYNSEEFIAAESTYPVLAGLEYRKNGESRWIKPELSNNPDYFNIDQSGISPDKTNETLELIIPDPGKPLFSHAVKESGKLDYTSYGINWFSRARYGSLIHTVETTLRPANQLLPPTNVSATLIQKERPLLLTTAVEQELLDEIGPISNDRTFVRLTFEYNHAQELIDYHHKINGEVINNYLETPDNREAFADEIQLFFRDHIPSSVYGEITAVTPQSTPLLLKIETGPYTVLSQGINENIIPQTVPPTYNEVYTPYIAPGDEDNFVGSILLVNSIEYVIQEVDLSGPFPAFTILKSDASGAMLNVNSGSATENSLPDPIEGYLFMAVENMQNSTSWDLPTQIPFSVNIDHIDVHREEEIIIENIDCNTETHVQKFRGIYHEASIERWLEKVDDDGDGYFDVESGVPGDPENDDFVLKHQGLYKITFNGFSLPQHSQYFLSDPPGSHSVEWYNGVVRLQTLSDVGNTPRKEFKVIRTENISTPSNLILYAQDLTFPIDENDLENYKGKVIADGSSSNTQKVNYYPGYKVYLYKDDGLKLNSGTVMPQDGQDVRYTIFGLRSKDAKNEFPYDNTEDWFSKFSVPAVMFASPTIEPVKPQKPSGGLYATRPDYFGKSTYTFTTKYGEGQQIHKPYAVQFNRASDVQFLSAIYDTTVKDNDAENFPVLNTLQEVMKYIFMEGEEEWYVDRWNDLLGFEYPSGEFAVFEGRQLPIPDNKRFIAGINAFIDEHNRFYNLTGSNRIDHLEPDFNLNTVVIPANLPVNDVLTVKDFLRDALLSCFVPLTEIPVVYNYVNDNDYTPIPKKQVIRDRDGDLLKPTDTNFDMAPMMKRLDPPGQQYQSQFTDFGLDGASNAKYFYAVREMNNQFSASPYSEILGPISLVNTAPPIAPQIIKVIPVLESRVLGTGPKMQLQINNYPKPQHVAKASIYRTQDPNLSLSVRTMDLVKVIDLEEEDIINDTQWILEDNFEDLPEIPFGDPLFYRLTVSRRIKYNDVSLNTIVEYAPSEASKLIVTNIAENSSPVSPTLDYFSEPLNANNELHAVILHWQKTCYKGKYHVYKMNSQGNWVKIHELQTNDTDIYLPLVDTQLETGTLVVVDVSGNTIYHHFKVIAENTAGMLSREENILTVYTPEGWKDIGGIGDMITGNTFIIR